MIRLSKGFIVAVGLTMLLFLDAGKSSPGICAPASKMSKRIDITNLHKSYAPETKLKETPASQLHIDQTLRQSLNLVIPSSVHKNLNFDAGYDKFEGLPTLQFDYFMPLKHWSGRSLFVSPRVSLTGARESFSFGLGTRHMITADSLIGLHVFHDWVRPRRTKGEYLRQLGVGMEFSALPGIYSDLSVSANAYFPMNERFSLKSDQSTLIREILPIGYDAKLSFLLPALVKSADIRLDGQVHSYTGDFTNLSGYKTGLNVRSRNGLWSLTLDRGHDSKFGSNYKVEGNVTVTFDWAELLEGSNPFSAPYKMSDTRFSRKMHDSLYQKVARKHDLPFDKTESRVTLTAEITNETVFFSGGFPHLPHQTVTLQTSQSPWEDFTDVRTDGQGTFAGQVQLPPGIYKIRLIHKPTGRASNPKTIVIEDKTISPDR